MGSISFGHLKNRMWDIFCSNLLQLGSNLGEQKHRPGQDRL